MPSISSWGAPEGLSSDFSRWGRDRAEEGDLAEPARAVGPAVAGDLAGAHRETDEDGAAEVEGGHQGVEVGGEGVVVVAAGGLAGLTEAAAVVGDDAVAGADQGGGLALPGVAVEGEAVDEDDGCGAGRAEVLVVELDLGAVLPTDRDVRHVVSPYAGVDDVEPRTPHDLRGF